MPENDETKSLITGINTHTQKKNVTRNKICIKQSLNISKSILYLLINKLITTAG